MEGIDFYYDKEGLWNESKNGKKKGKMVLTEHYLRKRGYCCNNGCRHCPYKSNGKV